MKILWLVNIVMPELAVHLGEKPSVFGGWLSGNSDVLDTVDYIKHTALEHETLEITGDFAEGEVTINGEVLTFENGVASYELTAGESYLLKLERKDGDSISYSIALA